MLRFDFPRCRSCSPQSASAPPAPPTAQSRFQNKPTASEITNTASKFTSSHRQRFAKRRKGGASKSSSPPTPALLNSPALWRSCKWSKNFVHRDAPRNLPAAVQHRRGNHVVALKRPRRLFNVVVRLEKMQPLRHHNLPRQNIPADSTTAVSAAAPPSAGRGRRRQIICRNDSATLPLFASGRATRRWNRFRGQSPRQKSISAPTVPSSKAKLARKLRIRRQSRQPQQSGAHRRRHFAQHSGDLVRGHPLQKPGQFGLRRLRQKRQAGGIGQFQKRLGAGVFGGATPHQRPLGGGERFQERRRCRRGAFPPPTRRFAGAERLRRRPRRRRGRFAKAKEAVAVWRCRRRRA